MALPQDGQDANGLTKVTQIPAGKELMFIDPTTNEGGIITLEDLTKQILNGLASQAFALDAGQKTIIQALNTLNSDSQMKKNFINPESTDDIIYGTTATIGFYKTGRTASIYFNIEAKQMLASNSFVTIANVPDSYLPEQNIILNYITQKGTPMLVNINKTKKIISLFNNNTEIKNDWVIRQVITYLSAS